MPHRRGHAAGHRRAHGRRDAGRLCAERRRLPGQCAHHHPLFGPAAWQQNITSNFSDAQGNFAVTLASAEVCARPGTITFTAEDQDRPASPPVNATCKPTQTTAVSPPAPATADGGAQPGAGAPGKLKLKTKLPRSAGFVTVNLAVDLYDAPGGVGRVIGVLPAGAPKVRLVEPCTDNWCHVHWPAGEGWVYSGPDYQSLALP